MYEKSLRYGVPCEDLKSKPAVNESQNGREAGDETSVNPLTMSASGPPGIYPADKISEGKDAPPLLMATTF